MRFKENSCLEKITTANAEKAARLPNLTKPTLGVDRGADIRRSTTLFLRFSIFKS
jgi:hypothetical protein